VYENLQQIVAKLFRVRIESSSPPSSIHTKPYNMDILSARIAVRLRGVYLPPHPRGARRRNHGAKRGGQGHERTVHAAAGV